MDFLLRLVEKEKINITYLHLRKYKETLWGLYVPGRHEINPSIFMEMELKYNPRLHKLARCVLAEELGHHYTGIGSYVFKTHANYSLDRRMSADDEKALRWATSILIPTNKIVALLEKGMYRCTELANYFGVTTWFMFRKMEFLQYEIRGRRQEMNWDMISQVKISCL